MLSSLIKTVTSAHGTHLCYVNEMGHPYKPSGTTVVRTFGDVRCTRNVYHLEVALEIWRSTGGGYSRWAVTPVDANGDYPHCENCSYKGLTLQKDCAGSGTAKYYTRVIVAYYYAGTGHSSYKETWGSPRTITC